MTLRRASDAESGYREMAPEAGLVSVVVPVHNRATLLVAAVESALAQSYPHLEVIVVDDASTDQTPAVAEELATRDAQRVRTLRLERNVGPGAAREAGRRVARGEYVQFLDSDDLLLPGKLEAQVAALVVKPRADVAYGWTRIRRLDGTADELPVRKTGVELESLFPSLLEGRIWMTATPLFRSSLVAAVGGWSRLRLDEDWELEARIGALGVGLAYVESWCAEHREHSGDRAGLADRGDPARLRDRVAAMTSIFECARSAGVAAERAEMATFARALFLQARRCGAAGLAAEARELFALARRASTPQRARGWDFRLVGALAATIGWRLTGRLAERLDARRARRPAAGGAVS